MMLCSEKVPHRARPDAPEFSLPPLFRMSTTLESNQTLLETDETRTGVTHCKQCTFLGRVVRVFGTNKQTKSNVHSGLAKYT